MAAPIEWKTKMGTGAAGDAATIGAAVDGLAGKFSKLGNVAQGADSKMRLGQDKQLLALKDKLAALRESQKPERVTPWTGLGGNVGASAVGSEFAASMARQDAWAANARKASDKAAAAMDKYRKAVDKVIQSDSKLASRSAMGNKTGANTPGGLFGQAKGPGLFGKVVQGAGDLFGPKGADAVMATGNALSRFSGIASKVGPVLGALAGAGAIAVGALVAVGAAAVAVWASLVGIGIQAGKYIGQLQAIKQAHIFAFTNLTGSSRGAEAAWQRVRAASERYGMSLEETGKSFNDLMAKGFSADEAERLVGYMADLKTLNPSANIEALSRAISQIKSKGRLQQEELTGQLAEAGLNVEAVYEQLEKKLGKDRKQVLAMITAGQIDSATAIDAIQAAIAEQTGKSPGGLAAEAISKSFVGQMLRARSMMQGFLADLKIDFTPLTRFIDKVEKVFKGGAGAKFGAAIEGAFARVGAAIDKWTPEDIEFGFEMLTVGAEAVGAAMEMAVNGIRIFLIGLREIRDTAKEVNAEVDALQKKLGIDVKPVGFEGLRQGALGGAATSANTADTSLLDQVIAKFAGGSQQAPGTTAAEAAPVTKNFTVSVIATGVDQPTLAKLIAEEVQAQLSQGADAPN